MKHGQKRILLLLTAFFVLSVCFAAFFHGQEERFQAAYNFNDSSVVRDIGGQYPLSEEFFPAVERVEGYRGKGIHGYISFDNRVFAGNAEMTFALWLKLSSRSNAGSVLYAGKSNPSDPYLEVALVPSGDLLTLRVVISDGKNVSEATADLSAFLSEEEAWKHLAFTLRESGAYSLLTIYVDGEAQGFSTAYVDLTKLDPTASYLCDYPLDEVYITNAVLNAEKIASLMQLSLTSFFESEEHPVDTGTTDTGSESDSNTESDIQDPGVLSYSWVGYSFDHSYNIMKDLHGIADCQIDYFSCNAVNTENFRSKWGYALIRKTGAVPEFYLRLDNRLLNGKDSFTFAAWIYRTGSGTGECSETLIDFSGRGILRFAPYCTDENGTYTAFIEYSDSSNLSSSTRRIINNGAISDPSRDWVHYALTMDAAGIITVYVDAKAVATYETGLSLTDLHLTQLNVVSGGQGTTPVRTALDEVYLSPRQLSASEIRKLEYYGLEKYVSSVLPDPSPEGGGSTETPGIDEGNTAEAEIDKEQDAYSEHASINGFIGTSFDDASLIGKDFNNFANALVVRPSLTQGINRYGLQLNGDSFLRYPIGILDGIKSVTVGISYQWNGSSTGDRNQRLFDFSYKQSSASSPERYLYLEMGDGTSGMRFCMFDGVNSTELAVDCNDVGIWNRVTVTVSDGTVTVYLNDKVAASCKTQVDLSKICPNFCYIGRSGVRGDPMFRGTVDEIYISSQALPASQVASYLKGIDVSAEKSGEDIINTEALWDRIITGILIATGVLVALIIAAIVFTIVKKDRLINKN